MSELSFYDLTYDGPVVQAILDTAQKLRTDGYVYLGAGNTSTVPGTPTERVWYLCGPGTYANFGASVTVPNGSVMVASFGGATWTKTVIEVTSGLDVESEVLLTDYAVKNCSLGTSTWYMSGAKGRHRAIPVTAGDKFRLVTAGYYGWLTSSYNPSVDPSNGDTVPYVSGTNRMYVDGGDAIITAPSGAAYLCLTVVDGAGTSISNTLYSVEPVADAVTDVESELSYGALQDTHAGLLNFHINNSTFLWYASTTYRCKLIDISGRDGQVMTITKNASGACRYAFLMDSVMIDGVRPSYCVGTSLVEVAAGSSPYVDRVPVGAKYLYLYADANGTDVTPTVMFDATVVQSVSEQRFVKSAVVDLSSLTQHNCTLNVSTWAMAGSGVNRHVAIAVSAGQVYRLTYPDIPDNSAYASAIFGFMGSSYDPSHVYVAGDAIPYVSGTGAYNVNRGNSMVVRVPYGCSYIVCNVVAASGSFAWTVERGTLEQQPRDFVGDVPVKFRIAHWNIGHFSQGASYDTTITQADYPTVRPEWAAVINGVNADIFMCCEYNANMVNASGDDPAIVARDAIFGCYQHGYIGSRPSATSYMMTAIFANKALKNVHEVVYPHTVQAGRYYQVGEFKIGTKTVKVVETHLDLNQGEHGAEYRAEQIQQLIADFADDEYVIIGGDFNVQANPEGMPLVDEYKPFADAGYDMANWGYLGYLDTYSSQYFSPLDNIVAKGFKVLGIHVLDDVSLSDHYCIYADFTMV